MSSKLGSFLQLDRALGEQIAFIERLGVGLQLLSLNAQIRAAGLSEGGRTLQVVAGQMNQSARSITSATDQICQYMQEVTGVLRGAAFGICTSDLSIEMMSWFLNELREQSDAGAGREDCEVRGRISELAQVVRSSLADACQSVRGALEHVERLHQQLDDFLKQIRTLEILHCHGQSRSHNLPRWGEDIPVLRGRMRQDKGRAPETGRADRFDRRGAN